MKPIFKISSSAFKEIIAVVLLLAVSAAGIFFFMHGRHGEYAVISLNGEEVCRRPLSEKGVFTVDGIEGMTFEISDEGVRVTDSDCLDKICVNTGYVLLTTESAVCMPNRVIVTVVSS
ncbi:MAG: NusG domain II-containing protein [Oscillospiraceae bacterium]